MTKSFVAPTTYFLQEGRENLADCLKVAFQASLQQGIPKIVIFTAYGEGVKVAINDFCSQPEYSRISLVAVTFPAGKSFTDADKRPIGVEITPEVRELMQTHHVPLVRAHLPFDSVEPGAARQTTVGRGFNLLGETLNMFCGSMSLCVQAVALACDAGHVNIGEHVISLTSDTAILATAATTRMMLSKLIVREILCKPAILTIGRKETTPMVLNESAEPQLAEKKRLGTHKQKRAARKK